MCKWSTKSKTQWMLSNRSQRFHNRMHRCLTTRSDLSAKWILSNPLQFRHISITFPPRRQISSSNDRIHFILVFNLFFPRQTTAFRFHSYFRGDVYVAWFPLPFILSYSFALLSEVQRRKNRWGVLRHRSNLAFPNNYLWRKGLRKDDATSSIQAQGRTIIKMFFCDRLLLKKQHKTVK